MKTSCYHAGKKTGSTRTTASMGKSSNMTGAKVTASAGKNSGQARSGVSVAPPQKGK